MVCELVLQNVSGEQKCSNTIWRDLLFTLRESYYHFLAVDLVQYNSWCQSNLSEYLEEDAEDSLQSFYIFKIHQSLAY